MNTELTGREGMDRAQKIRAALVYLIRRNQLSHGDMSRIAEHFGVTRERVRQLKDEELDKWQRSQLGLKHGPQRMADDTPLGLVSRG